MRRLCQPVRSRLETAERLDGTRLDMLSALAVLERTLSTAEAFSFTRRVVVRLATYTLVGRQGGLGKDALGEVSTQLWRLAHLSELQASF